MEIGHIHHVFRGWSRLWETAKPLKYCLSESSTTHSSMIVANGCSEKASGMPTTNLLMEGVIYNWQNAKKYLSIVFPMVPFESEIKWNHGINMHFCPKFDGGGLISSAGATKIFLSPFFQANPRFKANYSAPVWKMHSHIFKNM